MADIILLAVLGLTAVALLVGALMFKRARSGGQGKINYRTFFIIGITFLPAGVALAASTDNHGFYGMTGLGAIYLAISLANRDKWKQ